MSARGTILRAGYKAALRPLLFRAHHGDPEAIHETMISWLERIGRSHPASTLLRWVNSGARSPVEVAGVVFPGRAGLAAGMDKDGQAVMAWRSLGFSFAEIGTITSQAQPGNDRPRVFRLRNSHALINRMGFNNDGANALAAHLDALGIKRGGFQAGIPLGISIGKTKKVSLEEARKDYLTSLRILAPYADYIAVNVSSPNTPGLRNLQGSDYLRSLLTGLTQEAEKLAVNEPLGSLPIFLKVAPDIGWRELDEVLSTAADSGIRGIIATNTTVERHGLAGTDQRHAGQTGGLSGAPLTARAQEIVSYVARNCALPVIASGGVMTSGDAQAMLDKGALLIQLYTGFIYEGTGLVADINALQPTRMQV